jgi:hypothetical protein
MNTTHTQKGYVAYIAINSYRTSTDHGFANTWTVYRCEPRVRAALLSKGLAVSDQVRASDRGPVFSTMGIRPATAAERRAFSKLSKSDPWATSMSIIEIPDYSA